MAGRRGWGSIVFRDGRAYASVRIDGKRTMRLLVDEDDKPVPADVRRAEAAMELLRRKLTAASDIDAGERARLGEWLDHEYSAILRSRLTLRAAEQNEAYIVRFAEWCELELGADAFMHDVGRQHAERFCADFLAGRIPSARWRGDQMRASSRPYKPSYLKRVVNTLSRAWDDARERGFVAKNPWAKLRLPRIRETVVPWVEPFDLERVLAAANDFQRPYLTFLAWTGLRVGEAEALLRDDVDLERAVLHVRSGKTRGARRSVPLTTSTVELIRSQPRRGDGRVFEPHERHGTLKALTRACQHVGLPPLTLHQLRHVYASHLVVAGAPPTVVASLLGHVDGGVLVLRLYGRWYPVDAQTRAVAAMAAFRSTRGSDAASQRTEDPPSDRTGRSRRAPATPPTGPSPPSA